MTLKVLIKIILKLKQMKIEKYKTVGITEEWEYGDEFVKENGKSLLRNRDGKEVEVYGDTICENIYQVSKDRDFLFTHDKVLTETGYAYVIKDETGIGLKSPGSNAVDYNCDLSNVYKVANRFK